jgi:hypothetical protein
MEVSRQAYFPANPTLHGVVFEILYLDPQCPIPD